MKTADYPVWLAVMPDQRDAARADAGKHPDGRSAIAWDKEAQLWYARPGADLSRLQAWMPDRSIRNSGGGDPQSEFLDALTSAGLVLDGLPVMDGRRHRVPVVEGKKGNRDGVYRGFLDGIKPGGWFINYHRAENDKDITTWKASGRTGEADPLARIHIRAVMRQSKDDAAREQAALYASRTASAKNLYDRLPAADPAHGYLEKKGITVSPDIRQTRNGALAVPFYDADNEFRTLQYIPPDGEKYLYKDAPKSGHFRIEGGPLTNGEPVLYAEGYATARSLHMVTERPVVMTIDAGNMEAVATILKSRYPDSPHLFMADVDHTKDKNKGVLSAERAAAATGGVVLLPDLTAEEIKHGFTDFNDLHQFRGAERLRETLLPDIARVLEGLNYKETPMSTPDQPTPDNAAVPEHASQPVAETLVTSDSVPEKAEPGGTKPARRPGAAKAKSEEILALSAQGMKPAQIAKQLSIGQTSVYRILREQEAKTPDPEVLKTEASQHQPLAAQMQGAKDYGLFKNNELDAAELLKRVEADPAYKAGVLAEMASGAADMKLAGQTIDTAAFAEQSLNVLAAEVRARDERHGRQDYDRYRNNELDAAELLKRVEADPAYKAGVLAEMASGAADMKVAGQTIDTAAFAEQSLKALAAEAQASDERRGRQDYDRVRNNELDAAELQKRAEADPAYKSGFQAEMESEALEAEPKATLDQRPNSAAAPFTAASGEENAIFVGAPRVSPSYEDEPAAGTRARIDADNLLSRITHEKQADGKSVLYKLDGEPAFSDRGNRLVMAQGASAHEEKVLAALLIAAQHYHGKIELTGSDEFKAFAINLIVANDLQVSMKNASQQADLDAARLAAGQPVAPADAVRGDPDAPRETAGPSAPRMDDVRSPPVTASSQAPTQTTAQATAPEASPSAAAVTPSPQQDAPGAEVSKPARTTIAPEIHTPAEKARDAITGKVIACGQAPFRFETGVQESTFITLRTREGQQTFWGKELAGLLRETRLEPGKMVTLQWMGHKEVKVNVPHKNEDGVVTHYTEREALRNQWSLTPARGTRVQTGGDEMVKLSAFDVNRYTQIQHVVVSRLGIDIPAPPRPEDGLYWLRPDGQGSASAGDVLSASRPPHNNQAGAAVMSSWGEDGKPDLYLVQGDGNYLQGVVRQNGDYQHVLVNLPDSKEAPPMVVNVLTPEGAQPIGSGNGINRSNGQPIPREHVVIRLTGEDKPRIAKLDAPAEIPPALHARLGYDERYKAEAGWVKDQPAAAPQAAPVTPPRPAQ